MLKKEQVNLMTMDSASSFITVGNAHWYISPKKKDVYYPSVTTILSAFPKGEGFSKYLTAQLNWESSQDILKEAGRRGTLVHKTTEMLEAGGVALRQGFTDQEWEMLVGFVDWYKSTQPLLVKMESSIVSDKHKTGGTIDRVYKIGDYQIILDIKTSGAIYDNYWAQVAAYAQMYEEKHKTTISHTAILRLTDKKKTRFEYVLHDRNEWKEDFKIFKATQQIWDYLNPNSKPKIVELPNELSLK